MEDSKIHLALNMVSALCFEIVYFLKVMCILVIVFVLHKKWNCSNDSLDKIKPRYVVHMIPSTEADTY